MVWIKNDKYIFEKLKTILALILTPVAIYCAIKYSKECSNGILQGIVFCVTVLVPSLFVFMVIASYISNSKVSNVINRIFEKPTQKLLKLPKECASVMIMSLLGGYPIGAKCILSLYSNGCINKSQAKKMSLMAVSSGPGFVLNYIAQALLNNKQAGIILITSQIVAFFTVSLVVGQLIKTDDETVTANRATTSTSIVDAVNSGCTATINMCAMVILFSALNSLCQSLLSSSKILCDFIAILLEVTTACNIISSQYPLYVISFAVGFSGVCVHFQIFSILKDLQINKLLFFLIRILQGIIASFTTYILLILFPITTEVFSTVESTTPTIASSVLGSVALILTAICFINSISYAKLKRR